jgi:hypothetical protein
MTELYQILYSEEQRKNLYPFAIPYFNDTVTPFFENSIILSLVPASTAHRIGVCSWKLRDKLRFYIPPRRELTEDVLNSDYDILFLSRNSRHHQMLARASHWHPEFLPVLDKLLYKIGQKRPHEVKNPVYFNHFVASREIYLQYIKEMLAPAVECMGADEEMKKLLWVDSGYTALAGSPPERVQREFGVSFWPLHTFILERLFSIWIDNKNFSISHL